MQKPVKVEFVTRVVAASDETIAHRSDVARRLDELDHIDASAGEVNTTAVQWLARVNGTEIAVLDWGLQKLDDGTVAVSFVAIADAVSVGDPSLSGPAQSLDPTEAQQRADERRNLVVDRLEFARPQPGKSAPQIRPAFPGMSLGEQVAARAEATHG